MSREVDPQNPKSNDDIIYLAHRNMLSAELVEKLGGDEAVAAILRGDKVVKPKARKAKADEAVEEEAEEEAPEEETSDDEAGEDAGE